MGSKKYINVEMGCTETGMVVPKCISWTDGRKFIIDKVISTEASRTHEYDGIRYKVKIGKNVRNLYRLGASWYVLSN